MAEPNTTYRPGQRIERSWLNSRSGPGVRAHEDCPVSFCPKDPAYRGGDSLVLELRELIDVYHGHVGSLIHQIDTTAFRFYQDGDLVEESARPQGTFPMVPGKAAYRLELDVDRTARACGYP